MTTGPKAANIPVTCSGCGFSVEVAREAVPPGTVRATCPRCGVSFPFTVAVSSSPSPPTSPPTPPQPQPGPRDMKVEFSGTAREYFGIWIVNTLLKIVTLGVYTAWAKVRKRRYFFGNTRLAGAAFDYLADPLALLKGWLIGAGLFILYAVGTRVSPFLSSTLGTLFFVSVPWLIVRSRMFSLRNSSYRNIRFTFRENYEEAYLVFAGLVILTPFTLGLLLPYTTYRQKRFFILNSAYGATLFSFDARPKEFYLAYLKASGVFLLAAVMTGLLLFVGFTALEQFAPELVRTVAGSLGSPRHAMTMAAVAAALVLVVISLAVSFYLRTMLTNITWNATRLGLNRFSSRLMARRMIWLYASSAVAILGTCGLLVPWAAIRISRYRLECLSLAAVDTPERFIAAATGGIDASGEEIGDIFGIDMSL